MTDEARLLDAAFLPNKDQRPPSEQVAVLADGFSGHDFALARRTITAWSGYMPTPLYELPALARTLGVASILYKDEAPRFGLGSFKALGGAYAVYRAVAERALPETDAEPPSIEELAEAARRRMPGGLTVACATDGNHGRSVAWAARRLGCRCVIFLHKDVSHGREAALRELGAEVRRAGATYDESVDAAARTAAAEGWLIISDTSYDGYVRIPRDVMTGYRLIADEALEQGLAAAPPTHVFLQAGVGGFAASMIAHLRLALPGAPMRFIIVEPSTAACLYESARVGRRSRLPGDLDTVMAGLACGEPSPVAWDMIRPCCDGYMTIGDGHAIAAMRRLAHPEGGDPPIVCGESGAAGIAAAIAAAGREDLRAELGIGPDSRFLTIGTEGATDPEIYRRLVAS